MEECFNNAVHQLGQITTGAEVSPGLVIRVEEGSVLHQTRIRVICGFDTPQPETLAEAISDTSAAAAITDALSIQFAVADIVEGGTFDEQKTTVRYPTPGATKETPTQLRETPFIDDAPSLQVRRSDSLLPKIDQVRLCAEGMEITPGRVIQVEPGGSFDKKRRLTVFDDFNTPTQNPVARVICTESVATAITSCLQIQFGAQEIILSPSRFLEEKAGLRYQIPKSPSFSLRTGRYSYNLVSEESTSSRGR